MPDWNTDVTKPLLSISFSYLRASRWVVGLLIIGLLLTGCPARQATTSVLNITGFNYLPASTNTEVVAHTHYALAYAEAHEQAAWVAYELTPAEVEINRERAGNFREDPRVSTGSASLADYQGSGYDRGHLAPVGDMNFNALAMEESFFMSNISPQKRGFNGGIWSRLENQVRRWATEKKGIYVVTGPVLGKAERTIGENEVTVPDFFYKVLLSQRAGKNQMIGFMLPHQASDEDLSAFVEKVDNLEAYTGLDFFPALSDSVEEALESEVRIEDWF